MYRTGDLVRCRQDGVFEFLGRTDQQIKLRGHRIEPGEIESLLLRQPGVAEAVVVAEPDPGGDPRLMAYVVPNGAPADGERLRERLAEGLPEFMVPARVALVDRIPRTPNGKLDRRALAASRPAAPSAASALAPPRSELESRLARLWCETLGLERVGVEANFFDLGGHSLLVVRILNRMGEVTSRRVTLTDLFRFPTIRSLARFLSSDADPGALDEATERGRRRRERLRPGRKRLRGA
jgi:acyl carrier protein